MGPCVVLPLSWQGIRWTRGAFQMSFSTGLTFTHKSVPMVNEPGLVFFLVMVIWILAQREGCRGSFPSVQVGERHLPRLTDMCHDSREKFVYFWYKHDMMKNVSLMERECWCLDNMRNTFSQMLKMLWIPP